MKIQKTQMGLTNQIKGNNQKTDRNFDRLVDTVVLGESKKDDLKIMRKNLENIKSLDSKTEDRILGAGLALGLTGLAVGIPTLMAGHAVTASIILAATGLPITSFYFLGVLNIFDIPMFN